MVQLALGELGLDAGVGRPLMPRLRELAARSPGATPTLVLFVCSYLAIGSILMMNVLIAMMNFTFSTVWSESQDEWELCRAEHVIMIEKFYPHKWLNFMSENAHYIPDSVPLLPAQV